jgi:hypothetical protein
VLKVQLMDYRDAPRLGNASLEQLNLERAYELAIEPAGGDGPDLCCLIADKIARRRTSA